LALLDAARGIAVLAMVAYHFSWDLRYFGYITGDVESDLGWVLFARSIAGSFLFIVGVSLVLAERGGFDLRRYLRRLGIVAAGALAVTVATYVMFSDSFVFFGILHHIAVASVLGLPFVRAPAPITIAAAILCFLLPAVLTGPFFDHPWLIWLGFSTVLPRTNDFVPLFPWFGVVLAGIAAARLWLVYGPDDLRLFHVRVPWPVLWAGRQSLLIYLLHQPILFGVVYLITLVAPPAPLEFEPWFAGACNSQCVESEVDPDVCQRICDCLGPRTEAEGLSGPLVLGHMSDAQNQRYSELINQCEAAAGSE
jgi:uncharacterized membrane protein